MRILEIILKLAYLAASVYLFVAGISHTAIIVFLVASVLLGIVLIFNQKHPSYRYPTNYPKYNRVILMRRVEGVLILLFAGAVLCRGFF